MYCQKPQWIYSNEVIEIIKNTKNAGKITKFKCANLIERIDHESGADNLKDSNKLMKITEVIKVINSAEKDEILEPPESQYLIEKIKFESQDVSKYKKPQINKYKPYSW